MTAKKIPNSDGGKMQTCFTPFITETGSARVIIIGDQSIHIVMKRLNKSDKMGRTTQIPPNPLEHLATDRVKGLCKIDEILIEVKILLNALFL